MNLRLAAQIAYLAVAGTALSDLESGGGPTGTPEANHGGTSGQVPVQAGGPGVPTLPAQSIAVRASSEIEKSGMPLEDWFESSLPMHRASSSDVSKPAVPAQLIHASLVHADLKVLDGGPNTGVIAPEQPLSNHGADSQSLTHQLPTTEAMTAKAGLEWTQTEQSVMNLDDQLMREIPLLFAAVPLEPQQESIGVGFKTVVVNGMLALGAVLTVIVLTKLDLVHLHSVWTVVLTVLAAIGTLYLILRSGRPRRRMN